MSVLDTAMQMGLNIDQAIALADRLGQIPRTIPSTSTLNRGAGWDAEYQIIDSYLRDLSRTRTVTINVAVGAITGGNLGAGVSSLGGLLLPRATGGSVIGPGTGTSDSIPALLSNGEHVLTAAEVRAMGGQENVYRFRRSLHAYADGGAVDYRAAARASFATGGAVTGSGAGSTVIENHWHIDAPADTNTYQLANVLAGETAFVARGSGQRGG